MSHIGTLPIIIPNNIKIKILSFISENNKAKYKTLIINGPKGEISINLPEECNITINNNNLSISLTSLPNLWGTINRKIYQAFIGLTSGHHRYLNINGVGYKASISNNKLSLSVGFSHPINIDIPSYISYTSDNIKPQKLLFTSLSIELLTQWLNKIVSYKPASKDHYKNKGIFISSN